MSLYLRVNFGIFGLNHKNVTWNKLRNSNYPSMIYGKKIHSLVKWLMN